LFINLFVLALFKLKPLNVAFWAIAPTYMAKKAFDANIDERIENLWRTHKNRVDAGKGATWHGSGHHENSK